MRLKNYDYSQDGLYFVTICVQNRKHLFGKIFNNSYLVYDAGLMVRSVWNSLPKYYDGIQTYDFVVMPNHIHGIIELQNANLDLSEIIRRFKTFTTSKYMDGVYNNNWKPFDKKLWQRNYHEHIIRTDKSLNRLQRYISNNPLQWRDDILFQ